MRISKVLFDDVDGMNVVVAVWILGVGSVLVLMHWDLWYGLWQKLTKP